MNKGIHCSKGTFLALFLHFGLKIPNLLSRGWEKGRTIYATHKTKNFRKISNMLKWKIQRKVPCVTTLWYSHTLAFSFFSCLLIFCGCFDFIIKGCVHYIFASLFLSLNESTCQMKENVFYFTSKPLFVLEKIKF